MLYNSLEFILAFLPITLAAYYLMGTCRRPWMATAWLVVASIIFYSYWDWHYLWLIGGSITLNFTFGVLLRQRPSRPLLAAAIAANLVILGYYKYSDFFVTSLNQIAGTHWPSPGVVLPLGISFFTFTQIAFLVDSYRDEAEELSFARYALFVTFFPHVIAGPIVHHRDMMSQFAQPRSRHWTPPNVCAGIVLFTLGLAKKVLIADRIAPWASPVFAAGAAPGCAEAWTGALAFTFQLYFDFSGYSDMAVGLALLFNIRMPDNFDSPYKAVSIIDFWQRWHMTLSRFLRDYLYIPLGGNRHGEARRNVNLLLTMFLGGLWHGAGWTFIVWGTYHGVLLVLAHAWRRTNLSLPRGIARPLTFVAVVVGWVVFQSGSMSQALVILKAMFHPTEQGALAPQATSLLSRLACLTALLVFVNVAPTSRHFLERTHFKRRHAILLALLFFFCLLALRDNLLTKTPNPFLYFQF